MQQFGYWDNGIIVWCAHRRQAELMAKRMNTTLYARDVSEPYVVAQRG